MDTKKTIKRLAIVLICLLGLALIGLNIYQHQKIRKAIQATSQQIPSENQSPADNTPPATVSSRSKVTAQGPALASGESQSANKEGDDLSYQLEAAQEELEMANKQLSDEEAKKAEQRKLQKELQKRYREDPSYKKSMKQSLDIRYPDLFKKLNLSSDKLDKFKDLLIEEDMAQQDIYYEYDTYDDTNLSKEQQEELNRRYEALHKEYESKYADFLGEDGYEIYQTYTETWSERYNVNNFMETLDSGENLTETQKESLIEAMNDGIKNVSWDRIDDASESSNNMYDEKNIARMLKNQDLRSEAYLKAANSILSPSQVDKFNAYLKKERDQFKLIMEMSALRTSTSNTENSSDSKSK